MRVAIADDGTLFREGLVLLLGAADHEVVAAHSDGEALLATLGTEPVDIALLDIRMPPGEEGGLTTAALIRERHPEVGLLLLSHYSETHYLRRMLAIGTEGIGYRLKERIAGVQMLNDTLERIAAREIVIEPVLAGRLVETGERGDGPLSVLAPRELEVLRLMAEGRANSAIARELFVSVKAVEKHVASLFVKLGIPGDATVHHRRVLAVLTYLHSQGVGGGPR
ncbi:DNA-binding response regulator [Mycetocola reblochoni]|uniref:DNA-binding response regulator n=2 Tax=Mycetocola reblochoni TaxID=331618 RepID=A0A3L6ZM68_9MICO|nr:response regulator transcription factor [Mycetocola reblochoni]RLP68928.1 DNA-binding response regulator [Mycetocola reblochoni]SJN15855.1 putative two-component system response regulator [Mycetocola reblochoni REB411]